VNVGTDHDTAAFAVESVRRWWKAVGQAEYPQARRLLITADAGGSNGYRTRAWKAELAALAVEVNTIAATGTRTGLRVRAELDVGKYPTGAEVSDAQMKALPLDRHDWHGDWNYTLRPREHGDWERAFRPPRQGQPASAPDPFDQPSPGLAWLCHPALTGLPAAEWDALIATLTILHDQQREDSLDRRRGNRPRLAAPGPGRRPVLTLADRLMATSLHYRLGLPQVAIAALFSVRPKTVGKRIRDVRHLLEQAGHTIHPAPT
jgi:hypothetical protein